MFNLINLLISIDYILVCDEFPAFFSFWILKKSFYFLIVIELEKCSLVSHSISIYAFGYHLYMYMKQIAFQVAKLLIDYMYTGYLGVNMTSVGQIISTSRQLGMEDVVQCCTLHLLNQLCVSTWAQVCMSEIIYLTIQILCFTFLRQYMIVFTKDVFFKTSRETICIDSRLILDVFRIF